MLEKRRRQRRIDPEGGHTPARSSRAQRVTTMNSESHSERRGSPQGTAKLGLRPARTNTRRLTCEIGRLTLVAAWTWATLLPSTPRVAPERFGKTAQSFLQEGRYILAPPPKVLSRKDRRQTIYTLQTRWIGIKEEGETKSCRGGPPRDSEAGSQTRPHKSPAKAATIQRENPL